MRDAVAILRDAGVEIPAPTQIYVSDEVRLARIRPGCVLYPGTRLSGAELAIGADCRIGTDGPAVLHDVQLGRGVSLGSGSFACCTILDGADVGPGAHVRPGCLLEEGASCAHTVGLKQTVLMPHVVLGSLINLCDCLMAGGTSRSDHSEVGSSYIHFNYTPHRDKATPSLLGDVPRGVMLSEAPIFLGGQGGIVGPVRIAYGTVIAAGTIHRHDVLEPGQLIMGAAAPQVRPRPYRAGVYGDLSRILRNNRIYLGNLHALRAWYRQVRSRFMTEGNAGHCCTGALGRLDELIAERVKQLDRLAARVAESLARVRAEQPERLASAPFTLHARFLAQWPEMKPRLGVDADLTGDGALRDAFLARFDGAGDYMEAVQALRVPARQRGAAWLQRIVDDGAIVMEQEV